MIAIESAAWCSYVFVVKTFLGKSDGKLLSGSCGTDALELSISQSQNEHISSLMLIEPLRSITRKPW